MILEAVWEHPYARVLEAQVFAPSGMTGAFVFGSKPLPEAFPKRHENGRHERDYYEGEGIGHGGVIASARDLGRFYEALFMARALLSAPMFEALTQDRSGAGYGMGLVVDASGYGHTCGDLGFASGVWLDRETQSVAIALFADAQGDTSWTDTAA